MMGSFHKILLFLLLLISLAASASAIAGACTYGEAIMALEQGNTVRGMALMRMAKRDGDERAGRYFIVRDRQLEMTSAANLLSPQLLFSLDRVNP